MFLASSSLQALPNAGCTFCNSRVKADIAIHRTLGTALCSRGSSAVRHTMPPPLPRRRQHHPNSYLPAFDVIHLYRRCSSSHRRRRVVVRQSAFHCFSRPAKGFHLFDVAWRDLQPTEGPLLCARCACYCVLHAPRRRYCTAWTPLAPMLNVDSPVSRRQQLSLATISAKIFARPSK